MRQSPSSSIRRSAFAALAVSLAFPGAAPARPPATGAARPVSRPVVTILGDSIAAGLGLSAADALPAQLEAALARRGVGVQVRGAGVSGDTSAGGLARADFSVQPDTAVCVVELGGNDFLQSIPPRETQRNLSALIAKLQARRIKPVLVGGKLPARATGPYGREFARMLARLGRTPGVVYAPDALSGVEDDPALKQRDGLHPNARGVRRIVDRLAPSVARALR